MKRFVTRARARGWSVALKGKVSGWRESLWSSDTLIFLSRPVDVEEPPARDFVFRSASPADGPGYERDIGTDTAESFAARLSNDTECCIVESDGQIVHASWVAREPAFVGEIARWFVPPERSAYIYESYTRPEVRGRGIYPFVLASIAVAQRNKGAQQLWIGVQASNAPSRRSIDKAGFKIRFEFPYSRRFGLLTVGSQRVTMLEGGDAGDHPPMIVASKPSSKV